MSFVARWGRACGRAFDAQKFPWLNRGSVVACGNAFDNLDVLLQGS
jgi:hypothetical protein